jgi:hypothetical protein
MASSIVEVDSRIAPAGEAMRRGGSTSRRIGEGDQDVTGRLRGTLDPLGRFPAALTCRRGAPFAPGERARVVVGRPLG